MTDVTPAPAAQQLIDQAQHECGHAAVSIALGYPVERITLTGPGGPATYPVKGVTKLAGQLVLINASGAIADYQRRDLRMRGSQIVKLLFGGGDTFELDDASGQVAVRPSRELAVAPGADLQFWADIIVREHPPAGQIIAMWRECEAFTAGCRPASDALAAELLSRSEVDGADASRIAAAAMSGHPVPVPPAWAQR
jgi:hypothetical protein